MSAHDDYDLVIVGAGLVGATLACALAGSKLRIALIEAHVHQPSVYQSSTQIDEDTAFEPRVSALTLASKNLFASLSVWPYLERRRHSPFSRMQVWDADGTGEICFDAADQGQPNLGYVIENSLLIAALDDRLQQQANVDIIAPVQIQHLSQPDQGRRRLVLDDGRVITTGLVVGADGAQSQIRQLAGLETRQWDYGQQAIVTTVELEQGHQATAWQRFLPTGPLAFLPLRTVNGSDRYCSIVWSQDTERAQELIDYDDARFSRTLQRAFESRLGAVVSVDRRYAFPLRQCHAKTYIASGLALVGDAAHRIHPLAGQGVNLGFMDVAVLAEEILRAAQRGLAPGEAATLARYQRRRMADNMLMMAAVEGFKRLFAQQALPLRWLRSEGMRWVNRLSPLKQRLADHAMGFSGEMPSLAAQQKCPGRSPGVPCE